MTLIEFLTNCADALREKLGITDEIPASEYPDRIRAIETGVDTSDATVSADDVAEGKTFYGSAGKDTGTVHIIEPSVYYTLETGDVSFISSDSTISVDAVTPEARLLRANAGVSLEVPASNFGDATEADVVAGKTFTSAAGVKKIGTAAISPFSDASCKITNQSNIDMYVSYQTADGDWNTAYVSADEVVTLTVALGGWITVFSTEDGTFGYFVGSKSTNCSAVGPGSYPVTLQITGASANTFIKDY